MGKKILIVEDDVSFGVLLQSWFTRNGFEAGLATKYAQAKQMLSDTRYDLVASDLRLPDGDGIMLLTWMREKGDNMPVIIMTSYAEVQSAVLAMKLGASDYLEKPVNPDILKQKVEQLLTEPKKTKKPSSKQNAQIPMVKGNSDIIKKVYEYVDILAPTKISVLILGESGSGKEYIARMIHSGSDRSGKPFIAVDCGSLSKELAPSELFGHLKGSFTSAIGDKKGVFEQADGGTVFLDEIGNLSYEVQIQLLRALQEHKVRPVGSSTDISVDVRIIAATNENLEQAIAAGRFRQDLYHRINEFSLTVPPLRERVDDIEEFANFFVKQANEELGKSVKRFSDAAVKILKQQYWQGNLRELRNVVRRCVLFAQGETILPENLPFFPQPIAKQEEEEELSLYGSDEKEQIETALKKARGNKTVAAKLLRIDRKTLYNKMHQYNMDI